MMIVLAGLTGLGVAGFCLWPLRRQTLARPAVPLLVLSVTALALAGYAMTGKPHMPARAAAIVMPATATRADIEQARMLLLQDPGNTAAWTAMASGLHDIGQLDAALEALDVAGKAMPRNADLWVARGQLLVKHAGGEITPAARLAFDRAAQIDPAHPAPRYMLALSWVMQGKPQEALPILMALERDTPADATYRGSVERLLRGVRTMMAAGVGQSVQ